MGAGIAAAIVGLSGMAGGLLWLVAGVCSVRALSSRRLSPGWALAVLGAGFRWGTTGLADVRVATKLVAPTISAGTVPMRACMAVLLVVALLGEAQTFTTQRSWQEWAAAGAAVVALPPLFVLKGSTHLPTAPLAWAAGSAAAALVVFAFRPIAARIPAWVIAVVALAAFIAAGVAS